MDNDIDVEDRLSRQETPIKAEGGLPGILEDDEVRREGESDPEGDVLSVTEYSLVSLLLLIVLVDVDEDDAVDAVD